MRGSDEKSDFDRVVEIKYGLTSHQRKFTGIFKLIDRLKILMISKNLYVQLSYNIESHMSSVPQIIKLLNLQ